MRPALDSRYVHFFPVNFVGELDAARHQRGVDRTNLTVRTVVNDKLACFGQRLPSLPAQLDSPFPSNGDSCRDYTLVVLEFG